MQLQQKKGIKCHFLKISFLYILFYSLSNIILCNDVADSDNVNLSEYTQESLFVSLGSYCEPAQMLRHCGMRKVAFPFDWLVSFDGEALIKILANNFAHFLDEKYFMVHDVGSGSLLHTHYRLEFLHDGDWRDKGYVSNMQQFIPKYTRRIDRFRQLQDYSGKVIFIRAAYIYSLTDPHRYYKVAENVEITPESSLKLYNILKKFFPKLNFSLIIINTHDRKEKEIEEEACVFENIRRFRANPSRELLDVPEQVAAYRAFFTKLLNEKEIFLIIFTFSYC